MATSYGDDEHGGEFTEDEMKRIIARSEAYAERRAELAPKAFEAIGGPDGWDNGILQELGRGRTVSVLRTFLLGALCGIEMEKLEQRIPAKDGQIEDLLTLCRLAGCDKISIERLRQRPLPRTYGDPQPLRCCLLRPKSLLSFSQIEVYVRTRGLRFGRPEQLLRLAAASPELRFRRCYALGGVDGSEDGGSKSDRVFFLSDHGNAEKPARFMHDEILRHVWTSDSSLLAVKVD